MTRENKGIWNPNPSGKGGFQQHPENINSGYWDSTKSISYQYKRFLKMTPDELKEYVQSPMSERTVAMEIAYSQIIRSRTSLMHAKEVTDRTEGKAPQLIDLDVNERPIDALLNRYGLGEEDAGKTKKA